MKLVLDKNDIKQSFVFFKMQVTDRYLGSFFGIFWMVFSPLLMFFIYTFVFGFVFKTRIPGSDSSLDFIIWLISGFGPWLAISETIMSSANSIVSSRSLLKNLVFKAEILPISFGLLGLIPLMVSFVFVTILMIINQQAIGVFVITIPLAIILQLVFSIGIGYFCATFNVFLRDVAIILPSILMLILFTSPIFFPLTQYPESIQRIMQFNPFYLSVEFFRGVLVYNRVLDVHLLIYYMIVALLTMVLGYKYFSKRKKYFPSYL